MLYRETVLGSVDTKGSMLFEKILDTNYISIIDNHNDFRFRCKIKIF